MASRLFLHNFHFSRVLFLCPSVVGVHLLAFAFYLFGDHLVEFELAFGLPLCLTPLSHKHLPATHIVHSLILMSEKVSLDQRTVTHIDAASSGLQWAFATDVGKRHLRCGTLAMLLVRSRDSASYASTTNLVGIGPVRELGRLDDHSCEELTEGVQEVSLGLSFLDLVTVFGEGRFEAMIDSLRQVIVERVEELLFRPC